MTQGCRVLCSSCGKEPGERSRGAVPPELPAVQPAGAGAADTPPAADTQEVALEALLLAWLKNRRV